MCILYFIFMCFYWYTGCVRCSIDVRSCRKSLISLTSCQMYFEFYWNCRDSLFASGISSSTKLPPSNTKPPGTYKFSTFGYNPLDDDVVAQEIPMQSTYHRRDASITPNRSDGTSPGVVYTYEHPNKYDTPSPASSSTTTTAAATNNLRTFTGGSKKNSVKMEQSQLMLEIRNSAPDVIIMTSHWDSNNQNQMQQHFTNYWHHNHEFYGQHFIENYLKQTDPKSKKNQKKN